MADPNGKNVSVAPVPSSSWDWEETLGGGADAKIVVSTPGVHTFNLWMKEDGLYVDRIILTTDVNYNGSGWHRGRQSRNEG